MGNNMNCHSHQGSSSIEGPRVMIDGLEDHIWVPDIYIWEHISFMRGNSLVRENMNMFYIHKEEEGVNIDMTFDVKAVIGCPFNVTPPSTHLTVTSARLNLDHTVPMRRQSILLWRRMVSRKLV